MLGIDIDPYKRWIEIQMTPEKKWSNIEIDHVRPNSSSKVSSNEELRGAFCWRNTQPLFKKVHQQRGIKYNLLDYQLQFIKAYQFLKLYEKGPNQNLH